MADFDAALGVRALDEPMGLLHDAESLHPVSDLEEEAGALGEGTLLASKVRLICNCGAHLVRVGQTVQAGTRQKNQVLMIYQVGIVKQNNVALVALVLLYHGHVHPVLLAKLYALVHNHVWILFVGRNLVVSLEEFLHALFGLLDVVEEAFGTVLGLGSC